MIFGLGRRKKFNILENYSASVARSAARGIPPMPPPAPPSFGDEREQEAYDAEYWEAKPAMDALYKKFKV